MPSFILTVLIFLLMTSNVYAQAEGGAQSPTQGLLGAAMPFLMILVIFYFIIFRPQKKQMNERKAMLKALGRGDEVITNGGIYGKITDLTENFVMLQIAQNVTIKLDREQINMVRPEEGRRQTKK